MKVKLPIELVKNAKIEILSVNAEEKTLELRVDGLVQINAGIEEGTPSEFTDIMQKNLTITTEGVIIVKEETPKSSGNKTKKGCNTKDYSNSIFR